MLGWSRSATASASRRNLWTSAGEASGSGQGHLQGDHAVQQALPRLVDDPHAAPADLFPQLVVADLSEPFDIPGADAVPSKSIVCVIGPVVHPPPRGPHGPGELADPVVVVEERLQLGRQVGVAGEELLAVGRGPVVLGFEVGRDRFVDAMLPVIGA